MKLLTFLSCFIAFFAHRSSFSQSNVLKWGKYSDKELNIKSTDLDTTANAIILGEYGHIEVSSGNITIINHMRMKILNKNGFDKADISLPFYAKDDMEKITKVKAQTVNQLPNGKLEKISVANNQIFTIDINEKWKATQFAFPAVKEGSIIEYIITKVSKNYYYLDDWRFQKELPVLYSELQVLFPDVLEYNSFIFGNRLVNKYKGKQTNRFVLTDLPPAREQKFIYNIDNYVEKIRFQLVSYYKRTDISRVPTRVEVLESWENLAKEIMEDYNHTTFLKADKDYEEIIEKLNVKDKPPIERLELIYNYVNTGCRWNGENGIFNSQRYKDFAETKSGNTADINLYLTGLLRTADIKANPLLISTRSHGNIYKNLPLLSQFNRLIVCAEITGRNFFINATDPQRSFKIPELNDYVEDGYLLIKDESKWIGIDLKHNSRSYSMIDVHIDEAGKSIFDVSSQYDGFEAYGFRKGLQNSGNLFLVDQLKNKNVSLSDSLIFENKEINSKPLKIDYQFQAVETAIVNGELIYFDPFIFNDFQHNYFTENRREYPIELPYENSFTMIMNLYIPAGFEVIGLPKSESYKLPEDKGEFSYKTRFLDDFVQISVIVRFNDRMLPKSYNDYLREFYDIIGEKLNEQIVMKKIAS